MLLYILNIKYYLFQMPVVDENMTVSQAMEQYNVNAEDCIASFDLGNLLEDEDKGRFSAPVCEEDIRKLITSQKNKNTEKATKWSMNIFNEWRKTRMANGAAMPELIEMDIKTMDFWLKRFVLEVRKKSGEEYPPKSLYYIVCGIMRFCKDNKLHHINFFDEKDASFAELRKVLDARMKELLGKGLGTRAKKADALSEEDEEILWCSGIFGQSSATSLQYTVFFYSCKMFGLRGRDEHRNLKCSQFELGKDKKGQFIRFIGRNNKNYAGGLAQLRVENKDIKHYCTAGNNYL